MGHAPAYEGALLSYEAAPTSYDLAEFIKDPKETHIEPSREFVSSFNIYFDHKKEVYNVYSSMFGRMWQMSIQQFCVALKLSQEGKCEVMKASMESSLEEFWRSIYMDDLVVSRGKLNCIQHPALRYFAAFLVRGILARDNASGCTQPIIYLLKCVVDHVHTSYNVGALALACQHNSSTALYYGGLATMIGKYIESDYGFSMANGGGEALGTKWLGH
jgi:hypothetical protein